MIINISGKHMDIGDSLKQHAEERTKETVEKYLGRVNNANIVILKEVNRFTVSISANTGTHDHVMIRGVGKASDVYVAFDEALGKIEVQLRKYKGKLTKPRKNDTYTNSIKSVKYIIDAQQKEISNDDEADSIIIAEKMTNIEVLTVSDAVMRMNLADLPALLFLNAKTNGLNLVYKRDDGNISWIEAPKEKEK